MAARFGRRPTSHASSVGEVAKCERRWERLFRRVRGAGPNGNGLHAALGGGNTMPLTPFTARAAGCSTWRTRHAGSVDALRAKIGRLFGVTG